MTVHLSPDEISRYSPTQQPWGLETMDGPLPLTGVYLGGTVTGLTASLTFIQTFRNDRTTPIEAVYTFPLPDHFAVAGLTATLGDREVVGRIDDRRQARADYEDALERGHRAALVEQERGDIFTAQLGNLGPGEEAKIQLELAGRLGVDSGEATLRIPLLVGERYHPGRPLATDPSGLGEWPDTDQVPDASRISPPRHDGSVDVAILIEVEVDPAGLLVGTPRVGSKLAVEKHEESGVWMLLDCPDTELDRDLVARFGVRQDETRATALFSADIDDPSQGTWQVAVSPPEFGPEKPRIVVLALDRSGSMDGWKMIAARRAAARIIDSLGEEDSFCVLGFDHGIETVPGQPRPVPATDRNRYAAVRWLSGLEARGGTDLAAPLELAADALADRTGERVLVLLTDGQVGNEAALVKLLAERLQGVRIYALGVDHAVNATFLRRLATVGGGRCDLVECEDELDRVLQQLHRRIARPVARGLAVAAEGVRIDRDQTIPALVDVFAAGPTVVMGRWRGDLTTLPEVTVWAETDEGIEEWPATVVEPHQLPNQADALRNVWARGQLEKLQDDLEIGRRGVTEAMLVEFSLAHQVLCPFTAWLAIGPGGVTGPLETVVQPVARHRQGAPVAYDMSPAPRSEPRIHASMAMPDLDVAEFARDISELRSSPGAGRLRSSVAWFGLATSEDVDVEVTELAPFADRLRDLVARFRQGGDAALERELAELVSDLESVGAPEDLIEALVGLPMTIEEVLELWERHTGEPLE